MDDFERVSDGLALQLIRKEPGFYALERLIRQTKDDLFQRWTTSDDLTRDYCRGALEILDTLVPNVDATIEWAVEVQKKERELRSVTRGSALDGQGTGDLAL